jgi:hypothetical protein
LIFRTNQELTFSAASTADIDTVTAGHDDTSQPKNAATR